MNRYQALAFQEIAANAQIHPHSSNNFSRQLLRDKSWGSLDLKTREHPHVAITEYKANLNGRYQLHYDVPQMLKSMNICLALEGNVGLSLTDSQFETTLSALEHHQVYSNETAYSLRINQFVHVVHLAIDLDYYAALLCGQERWTDSIREKIQNKELICHEGGQINTMMKLAVQQILNDSFTGNLHDLMIEAKILEIVALQLNEFSLQHSHKKAQQGMHKSELNVFHDLRVYLEQHFTDDLSLKSLSKMFGLNEFKLKKGFKELFSITVFEYIHELKMNYSRQLLRDEQMYINEVAGKVGYKNPNHFSTAFKRKFGVSPTAIR